MVCLKCNKNRGFTLVEMVIVLGILALFLTLADSIYLQVRAKTNLKIGADSLVASLHLAQTNAQNGKAGAAWGVKIFSSSIVIFQGDAFATRITDSDQLIDLPNKVIASPETEFIFNRITGWPSSPGEIVLTNEMGNINLTINEKGIITY